MDYLVECLHNPFDDDFGKFSGFPILSFCQQIPTFSFQSNTIQLHSSVLYIVPVIMSVVNFISAYINQNIWYSMTTEVNCRFF